MPNQNFDYVIVGGGTSGAILANRLSADGRSTVLLVEAGADTPDHDTPPAISDAYQPWVPRLPGSPFLWPDFHIHRAAARHGGTRQTELYEQGRILGGGSSVNMTVANRGVPSDYDAWQAAGADGWAWRDVLPYFRKVERDAFDGVDHDGNPLHGKDGLIPITRADPVQWSSFTRAIAAALTDLDLPDLVDQNGNFADGHFVPTVNVEKGIRFTSARAYLTPEVRRRPNLEIRTDTQVLALLLEEPDRASGVRLRAADGSVSEVQAGEVVLAAGALQTPAILLRAGIGPAEDLRALGLEVRANLAGVGRNLWDHSSLALVAPLGKDAIAAAQGHGRAAHSLGIRASSGVDPVTASDLFLHLGADATSGLLTGVLWVNKPSSTGWLRLRDTDPLSYPHVDFNLLSDPRDIARLRAALQLVLDILAHPALAPFAIRPTLSRFALPQPGGPDLAETLADDAAFEAWLHANISGVWHASGTARIGRKDDPLAVTDANGRVHSIRGLRVADASLMPSVPAANTNLPTQMIAEKIADAILHGL